MRKNEIEDYAKKTLSHNRFLHTKGVVKVSIKLGASYKLNTERLEIASLLHDIAKDLSEKEIFDFLIRNKIEFSEEDRATPGILHGFVGEHIARNYFSISDKEILSAIKYHSTGHPEFGNFEKIIYLADYLDPSRKLKNQQKILKIALKDLNLACIMVINEKIDYIIRQESYIHSLTINFYNALVRERANLKNLR